MARKKAKNVEEKKVVILLEQAIPEIDGRNAWEIPDSYLEKDGKGGYQIVKNRRPGKTLLTNNIRKEVDAWRESGYKTPKGISQTSLTLLLYWFDQDHIKDGEIFHFRFAKREAIETTLYYYDKAYMFGLKKKNNKNLIYVDTDSDDVETNALKILEAAGNILNH